MPSTSAVQIEEVALRAREQSRWVIALGLLMALLGALAMIAAFEATIAAVLIVGVLLLVAGAAQVARAVADRPVDMAGHLLAGIFYLLAGGLIVYDPTSGAIGLTLLLALLFALGGVVRLRLGAAAQRRGFPATWFYVAGVVDFLLALLIAVGWPATGLWIIGLFVGIELLIGGLSLVFATLALKRLGRPAS